MKAFALLASLCAASVRQSTDIEHPFTESDEVVALNMTEHHDASLFDDRIQAMVDGVTRAQLEQHIRDLSGEDVARINGVNYRITTRSSLSGTPILRATEYVHERLSSYGLSRVYYQDYPGLLLGGVRYPGRNVIAELRGTDPVLQNEILVVSAHLDARPWAAPDILNYGADDDASGCGAVLYIARQFARHSFRRTIRFIFFGHEENAPWGAGGRDYGSGFYFEQARLARENTRHLNLDALAWNGNSNMRVYAFTRSGTPPRDPGNGDFALANIWLQGIATYRIQLDARIDRNNDNLSDHGPAWNNGFNAFMLIEDCLTQRNANWHQLTDRIDTYNWQYYTRVTQSGVAAAALVAQIV